MSQTLIFLFRVKARTGLVGVLPVAVNGGLRVDPFQLFKQLQQAGLLCVGPGVLCLAGLVQATDVDHADRMRVVPGAVCTADVHVPAYVDRAVQVHDIVVSDVAPAALADMHPPDCVNCHRLALTGGSAVHNDLVDGPLGFLDNRIAADDLPGLRPDDPVNYQAVLALHLFDGFLSKPAEDPVRVQVEQLL